MSEKAEEETRQKRVKRTLKGVSPFWATPLSVSGCIDEDKLVRDLEEVEHLGVTLSEVKKKKSELAKTEGRTEGRHKLVWMTS